ncbi:MAG: NADH-quinone oxidoreductase subunit M [Verrucomicrobiota bacterium]|nr:NADH-quinone oxidoreductase subunit M [Verrucomicrobiota bacterium]
MILLFIVFCPILAAALILLGSPARTTALLASAATLLATIGAFIGFQPGAFNYITSLPISADWRLNFSLGADGLSLIMLLLTAIVTVAAVWFAAPTMGAGHPEPAKTARDLAQGDGSTAAESVISSADERSLGALRQPRDDGFKTRAFYACLLFISAGAIGAFASLDLFFFYAFHELALIPTFLLIGIWGSGNRYTAAWKITIYLATGSFILLIGLIMLYRSVPEAARTFDLRQLQAAAAQIPAAAQQNIYILLLIGFGILISLVPFHTWAPEAYASAPAPAAMLHAGVLKKFGLYGLLRIAVPMLPEGQRHWVWLLIILLLGNIIYVGLVTIAQKRLDWILGYSSVMHMGYIFLGIASGNIIGTNGAAILMFAHGLSIALLFAIAGQIRERTGSLLLEDLGGLGKVMPLASFLFGIGVFASIGLPGFANFAAEVMVFFGAFRNGADLNAFHTYQVTTLLALWGVVISAVYMLRAYRATFMGSMNDRWSTLTDMRSTLRWPAALLIAAALWIGCYPQTFVQILAPTFRTYFAEK